MYMDEEMIIYVFVDVNNELCQRVKRQILDWSEKRERAKKWVVCIYPTPPQWAEWYKRSTGKWSKAGLNSDFSFS